MRSEIILSVLVICLCLNVPFASGQLRGFDEAKYALAAYIESFKTDDIEELLSFSTQDYKVRFIKKMIMASAMGDGLVGDQFSGRDVSGELQTIYQKYDVVGLPPNDQLVKISQDNQYVAFGKELYDFVLSISSNPPERPMTVEVQKMDIEHTIMLAHLISTDQHGKENKTVVQFKKIDGKWFFDGLRNNDE